MFYYVYRITNKRENKHYYGYRSSEIEPISDLGIRYKSSSCDQDFLDDQKNNPNDYKYKIIKRFDNKLDAIRYESKLHSMFDVRNNPNFYNRSNQTEESFLTKDGELYTISHGWITSEEYWKNKDMYEIHERKVGVFDSLTKTLTTITYQEYNSNRDRYKHHSNGMMGCFLEDGTHVFITTEEYYANPEKYNSFNKGKVAAVDVRTNETIYVSVEEYHSNPNLIHPSTGLVSTFDTVEQKYKSVTKEIYENNRDRYVGVNKGKVSGANNPNKKQINIYNENDDIMYVCDGNFKETCLRHGLPFAALSRSHRNCTPIYQTSRLPNKPENIRFKGWYARVVG